MDENFLFSTSMAARYSLLTARRYVKKSTWICWVVEAARHGFRFSMRSKKKASVYTFRIGKFVLDKICISNLHVNI
jgi:hypothetical protein